MIVITLCSISFSDFVSVGEYDVLFDISIGVEFVMLFARVLICLHFSVYLGFFITMWLKWCHETRSSRC